MFSFSRLNIPLLDTLLKTAYKKKEHNPENGKRDTDLFLFLLMTNTNIYKELSETPLYKIRFHFYIKL